MKTRYTPVRLETPLQQSQLSPELKCCLEECIGCHTTCRVEALRHDTQNESKNTQPHHVRRMLDCADACETNAYFMLLGSELQATSCALCSIVCAACAQSCEEIPGLEHCVATCRRCAAICRKMAAYAA